MKYQKKCFFKFNPLAISILLSLPVVVHADVQIQNGSISKSNGVTVVDISRPNSNGISHNIYDKLDVGREGLVFNNSQNGANTTLAGQISGNANLSSGSASVIINEVTSKNKSTLSGYMEVGGDKAYLVISNPNGITCTNCGFINTNEAILTTGKVDIQNDTLQGYSVNDGQIVINNLTNKESPTAILARSVAINGTINSQGQDLTVIAGPSYVTSDKEVTGPVGKGSLKNSYSIDIAKLGGMYANKISLVSTENGVGVRNLGVITAGSEGIKLDVKGRLINNSGQIKASGSIDINLTGNLENVTGKIASVDGIKIETNRNAINNSSLGNILSDGSIIINSGAFNNTNGKIASGCQLNINTNNNTLTNYGQGKTVGIDANEVVLETGYFNNTKGQINTNLFTSNSSEVANNKGKINVLGNLSMTTNCTLDNTGGLIRTASGKLKLNAINGTIINSGTKSADTDSSDSLGIIGGNLGADIYAKKLNNKTGQIASLSNVNIVAATDVNNFAGKILSSDGISIKASSLDNSQGGIGSKSNINIQLTGTLTNKIGMIKTEDASITMMTKVVNNTHGIILGKDIDVRVYDNLANIAGFIVAKNNLKVVADGYVDNTLGRSFGAAAGLYFGMPKQEGGMIAKNSIEISAKNILSSSSRIVAENGSLTLNAQNVLTNNSGMLVGNTGVNINANTINNHYGTIYSSNDLTINTNTLNMSGAGSLTKNNASGIISSDHDLILNINGNSNFNNYGWISGYNSTSVSLGGNLNNYNTIYSNNQLTVTSRGKINNSGDMVGDNSINISADGTISNSGNMFSDGYADIYTKSTLTNTWKGVLGGRLGLTLTTKHSYLGGKVIGL